MKTTSFPPSEPPFKPVEEPWLREGTALFALRGKAALKVEPLAAAVFVSKSSFYHHFADLDVFLHRLIEYHLFRCGEIAKKERRASSIDPELLDVLMEHRLDLLFHRQLRFQKHEPGFDAAVRASERITGAPFIDLWMRALPKPVERHKVEALYSVAMEQFYLKVNPETLNRTWLQAYFIALNRLAETLF